MANVFDRNTAKSVGSQGVKFYATPAGAKMVMLGFNLCNIQTSEVKATIKVNDVHMLKDTPIPAGSALSPLDGKIVLRAGDFIEVSCDTADGLDVVMSIMEQT